MVAYTEVGLLSGYLFEKKKPGAVLMIHVAHIVAGMLCRYVLEFGEVSNTYNFTLPNMAIHMTAISCICLCGFLHAKKQIEENKEIEAMKRLFIFTFALCCFLLTACNDTSVGIIGGADGPTAIFVSESHETVKGSFGEQYEKKPMRMMKIDGDLYYDTGFVSDMIPRCGTLDGNLKKTMELGIVPQKDGEANFEAEGYQSASSITKEVPIDGQWVIFKKFDGVLGSGIGAPIYGFYIKGRLNNAAIDSELAVLTDNIDITFSDVYEPMLSSQYDAGKENGFVVFDHVVSGDKWGLSLSAENVTETGMTLQLEQFGGAALGELQTGEWYKIEVLTGSTWQEVPTKMEDVVWHSIAYMISKNDVTQMDINWEFLYGALPSGEYRLAKEVMDFKETGNFEEELYFAYFTIE